MDDDGYEASSMQPSCRLHRPTVGEAVTAFTVSAGAADSTSFERLEMRLLADFSPSLRPEQVRRCLVECAANYRSASVRNYIELLVERDARTQLRALASSPPMSPAGTALDEQQSTNQEGSAHGALTRTS
jgi:hypothetical protein